MIFSNCFRSMFSMLNANQPSTVASTIELKLQLFVSLVLPCVGIVSGALFAILVLSGCEKNRALSPDAAHSDGLSIMLYQGAQESLVATIEDSTSRSKLDVFGSWGENGIAEIEAIQVFDNSTEDSAMLATIRFDRDGTIASLEFPGYGRVDKLALGSSTIYRVSDYRERVAFFLPIDIEDSSLSSRVSAILSSKTGRPADYAYVKVRCGRGELLSDDISISGSYIPDESPDEELPILSRDIDGHGGFRIAIPGVFSENAYVLDDYCVALKRDIVRGVIPFCRQIANAGRPLDYLECMKFARGDIRRAALCALIKDGLGTLDYYCNMLEESEFEQCKTYIDEAGNSPSLSGTLNLEIRVRDNPSEQYQFKFQRGTSNNFAVRTDPQYPVLGFDVVPLSREGGTLEIPYEITINASCMSSQESINLEITQGNRILQTYKCRSGTCRWVWKAPPCGIYTLRVVLMDGTIEVLDGDFETELVGLNRIYLTTPSVNGKVSFGQISSQTYSAAGTVAMKSNTVFSCPSECAVLIDENAERYNYLGLRRVYFASGLHPAHAVFCECTEADALSPIPVFTIENGIGHQKVGVERTFSWGGKTTIVVSIGGEIDLQVRRRDDGSAEVTVQFFPKDEEMITVAPDVKVKKSSLAVTEKFSYIVQAGVEVTF